MLKLKDVFFKLKHALTSLNLKTIFNGRKALVIKSAVIVFLFFVVYVLVFWIFIFISWDSKTAERRLSEHILQNFSRAVRFNSIKINMFGNIEIEEIAIANSTDFNDDINFIFAKKAVLDLRYADFWQRKLSIAGIEFEDCEFSIHRNYNSDFDDVLEKNLKSLQLDKLNFNDNFALSKGFYFSTQKAKIKFFERLIDSERMTEVYDLHIEASLSNKLIKLKCSGKIPKYKSHELKDSKFDLNFENHLKVQNQISDSKLSLNVISFDLSYLNDYSLTMFKSPLTFQGGIGIKTDFHFEEDKIKCSGNIKTENLNLSAELNSGNKNIFKDANYNSEFDFALDKKLNILSSKKFLLYSNVFKVNADEILCDLNDVSKIDFKYHTNKIDLDKLSKTFLPSEHYTYGGKFKSSGEINFFHDDKSKCDLLFNMNFSNFYFNMPNEKSLSKIDMEINAANSQVKAKMKAQSKDMDFNSNIDTKIISFFPLKTSTVMNSHSTFLNIEFLIFKVSQLYSFLFEKSMEQLEEGYDNVEFLKKPEAAILNNNDLNSTWKCDKLLFLNGIVARNIEVKSLHKSGVFRINEFKNEPVSGYLSVVSWAYLNSNYPFYSFKTSLLNFDLSKIDFGKNSKAQISGKFSGDVDFTLSAYRISDFLENTKSKISINLTDARFAETGVQANINNLFVPNGFPALPTTLHFPNFEFTMNQYAVNISYSLFAGYGGNPTFSTYGRYLQGKGFNTSFTVTVADEDKRTTQIPVTLKGSLLHPELGLSKLDVSQKLF